MEEDNAAYEALSSELVGLQEKLTAIAAKEREAAAALVERIGAIELELAALDAVNESTLEWDGDWRTADLDVNADGVIDRSDLETARAALDQSSPEEPIDEPITGDTVAGTPLDGEPAGGEYSGDDGEPTELSIEQATTESPA